MARKALRGETLRDAINRVDDVSQIPDYTRFLIESVTVRKPSFWGKFGRFLRLLVRRIWTLITRSRSL